ncbi:hypothetical protein ABKV19_025520 [Rosa sericea]
MASKKPHAVCIPAPSLGHIKAVLKLAKLLHHKGFHITFVNTESFHKRYLKSLGPNSLDGLPDFQFETIPDGLPDSDADPMSLLCENNHMKTLLPPFRGLLTKLINNDFTNPPVTCIVSDGFLWMFTIAAAQEIGVPSKLLLHQRSWHSNSFALWSKKGLYHSKDEGCFTNGFLDKVIDMVPGMKDIRLKDLPTFIRTTDRNDTMLNFFMETVDNVHKASAVVFPTFDALEQVVLDAFSSMFDRPLIYAIGPMQLLLNQMPNDPLKHIECSLWKEESECLQWLNSKAPNSVVYVNFGSVAFLTPKQLVEFGWGLANSKLPFMWVIRPGLVMGESATLPSEFVAETKERGLIASWCPQEEVLNHPSVGSRVSNTLRLAFNHGESDCWSAYDLLAILYRPADKLLQDL